MSVKQLPTALAVSVSDSEPFANTALPPAAENELRRLVKRYNLNPFIIAIILSKAITVPKRKAKAFITAYVNDLNPREP